MADFGVLKSDLKKDLDHFNSLETSKKLLAAAALLILFVLSITIGRTMSTKKTTPRVTATPSPAPYVATSPTQPEKLTTELSLASSSNKLMLGKEQTITVKLTKLPVAAVDIILNFDPDVLTVANIKNGSVFDRVFVNKVEGGVLSFSAAVLPQNADNLKEGDIFTFTVTPKKATEKTTIAFDTTGTITALNGENTLGKAESATYQVVK